MYREFNPPRLRNLISAIWYSDSDIDPNEGHVAPPSLGSQLVIKIYQSDVETILSGPATQQQQYPFVEGANYFGVQFAPSVGSVFDDILLKELKDTSVNIDKVLGIDLGSLAYQLHALDSWTEQKHLIETMICKKYPENSHFLNQNVLLATNVAREHYGNISIKDLAVRVGVSKRHLERLFLRHTGVSPKTFCTTLRIQRVLNILRYNPSVSLAHLALDCGYTDQAHLANEFKRVMGASILAYVDSAK